MDLKHKGKLENYIFHSSFWFVFCFLILFFLLLIIGLFSYSDMKTILHIFKHPEFRFSLIFTLFTSIIATILASLVALPSGYLLSRKKTIGSTILDTLLDMPIVLPPLVSGVALLIFFGPFLGKHLTEIGIHIVFTPIGVIVAQWFIATPYAIKTFKQTFQSIDKRMENVARTLGYSPSEVFRKVTIPLAKNGLIAGVMLSWTRTLGEFGATAMLAGITRMKTETLSIAVFLNMSIGDMNFAIATAIVMLIFALCLLIIVKLFLGKEVWL